MGLISPTTHCAPHESSPSGAGTDRRSGNRDLASTAAAMAGEEVGIKLVRLFSFIGTGAICTFAINTYRDLERKKALDAARAVENVAHNDK